MTLEEMLYVAELYNDIPSSKEKRIDSAFNEIAEKDDIDFSDLKIILKKYKLNLNDIFNAASD